MSRPITFAEAQLPLSILPFNGGTITLIDARGYFVLSLTPEQLREIGEAFARAMEPPPWLGQPIPKGPS